MFIQLFSLFEAEGRGYREGQKGGEGGGGVCKKKV